MEVLPWAMIPDAIEWDELRTGKRHEGMFFSFVTLAGKIDGSIALPLMLLALQWSGFVPNSAAQTPNAMLAIRLMTGPVPAVFLVVGIFFALMYPLTRQRHGERRAQLAALKATG